MSANLRVLNCLSDPRMGGPQKRTFLNAKKLRENTEIETEFLLPDGPDEFEYQLQNEGFFVHRPRLARLHPPQFLWENITYVGQFPTAVYRILELIRVRDIDILHVNSPTNFYPAIAGWLSDASVVWHFNGYSFPAVLLRTIKHLAPILADEFVFSSSVVRDHIFKKDVGGKIIFPPVDTEAFTPSKTKKASQIREKFEIDQTTPIVGTVGNITPAKDHKRLLQSIRRVIDEWGKIAVPIVGAVSDTKQDYFEQIQTLCDELGLSDYVFFLGWRSDIQELLAEFDLFVLSSKMETGPMSVMEAMAMGVPVITTHVGAIKDVHHVEEISWVVPPESPVALAEAVQEALNAEDQWPSIGMKSRRCAKKWFSLDQSSEKHYQLYTSLGRV